MPTPWLVLPSLLVPQLPVGVEGDGAFIVFAPKVDWVAETDVMSYSDGVTAIYGPTTIHAERLDVDRKNGTATATGKVLLTDPDGTASADDITIVWKLTKPDTTGQPPKGARTISGTGTSGFTATAHNITAHIAGATLVAETADISPNKWVFTRVYMTSCSRVPPLYSIFSPKLTVIPGRRGKAEHPRFSMFGRQLLTLPSQSFNLDPRVEGFRFPSVNYRKDEGAGVTWDSGFLLNDNTSLAANAGSYKKSLPTYSLNLSRSWIPPDSTRAVMTPRSDLAERFAFGYMENIEVPRPETERAVLRDKRNGMSVGTLWNEGTGDLNGTWVFSKPIELTYERGGALGDWGFISQTRIQRIREKSSGYISRGVLQGSIGSPLWPVGKNLFALGRIDSSGYAGAQSFGWVRSSIGLISRPHPVLTLGASMVGEREFGTPDYTIDRPIDRNGVHLRGDLNLGATRFSYLTKYDSRLHWYDREYTVSQVIGCLEAYTQYRKVPNNYRFGVKLRIDQFVDMLTRREFKRSERPVHPISTPEHP